MVPARERAFTARSKELSGPFTEIRDLRAGVTELAAIAIRLLEVVADDLLDLRKASPAVRSSQSANRTWRSARSPFGQRPRTRRRGSAWRKA